MRHLPQRFWYACTTATFLVILLGCSPTAAPGRPTPRASTSPPIQPTPSDQGVLPPTTPPRPTPSGRLELEIYSWWVHGADAQFLDALIQRYIKDHPGTEIWNSTLAPCGYSARRCLNERLNENIPPDSFQTQIGSELLGQWAAGGYLEPVTFLFNDNYWLSQYPPGVLDYLSRNDEIWGVPVVVHRTNVLWYNKRIFAQYHLEPPQTWDDFFAAAKTLQAEGVTPLALGDQYPWTTTLIFETILQGSLGAERYRGLWNGRTDWNSPEVKNALETLDRILTYTNEDHTDLNWAEATQRVINGEAAMTIMSDWAGYNLTSPTPNIELGYVPAPGTANIFSMVADAFVLPRNAPHRDLAVDWLTYCGSGEAQAALLSIPGAGIPAVRMDRDPALYDAYTQWAMESWASDQIVPSYWVGANTDWVNAIDEVMGRFTIDLDVETAAYELAQASQGIFSTLSRPTLTPIPTPTFAPILSSLDSKTGRLVFSSGTGRREVQIGYDPIDDRRWDFYSFDFQSMALTRVKSMVVNRQTPNILDSFILSPDGSQIAFVLSVGGRRRQLWLAALIGMQPGQPFDFSSGQVLAELDDSLRVAYAWSPDGARIAYASGGDIHIINTIGMDKTSLMQQTKPQTKIKSLAWSPTGSQIAFSSSTNSGSEEETGLWVMNSDGTQIQQVAFQGPYESPVWSPDGDRIAYLVSFDLYVVNADGRSGPTRLWQSVSSYSTISWSPNGAWIAFISTGGLYVVKPDRTEFKKILSVSSADDPVWSPDGDRLAFTSDYTGEEGIYTVNLDGSGLMKLPIPIESEEYYLGRLRWLP